MRDVPTSAEYRFPCKVYYEDTDCMGVVYHANYLKYFERARTEFLAARGISVAALGEQGTLFVVYRIEMTFKSPARLGDELEVVSRARLTSPYRVTFDQRIECSARSPKPLIVGEVEIVCIDPQGGLKAIPDLGL
ncbi:MAG: YbgC/FadM family acyl-CoA thioesterase [Deltaproteobacteria bacterium]|nr:YbgC/FadM family acyl-CoA thioesterase [Deltaproteobacteria bacterium]